jgi:hypothetical protein
MHRAQANDAGAAKSITTAMISWIASGLRCMLHTLTGQRSDGAVLATRAARPLEPCCRGSWGLWPFGDPSREDEANGNDAGEDYRHHEEVFPAQECDHDEAHREAPCDDWHR